MFCITNTLSTFLAIKRVAHFGIIVAVEFEKLHLYKLTLHKHEQNLKLNLLFCEDRKDLVQFFMFERFFVFKLNKLCVVV